jgi:hypothetical protein
MSGTEHCHDYWESCGGAIQAIIAEMPDSIQERIRQRLRDLAARQAKDGEIHASYFSRMVSGEKPPVPQQIKRRRDHLRLVKA